MTTALTLPDWTGQTVAVLACGPSLTQDAVEALSEHRMVAVNHACRLAPHADMLVAMDAGWCDEWRAFEGLRVTAVEDPELDAMHAGARWETVRIAPGHEIEIHNSGLAAIRLAAQAGAAKIILVGFDWPARPGHFYDDEVDTGGYVGLAEGLAKIAAELTAHGVAVELYAHV
jgi:hypothetical protein